MLRRSSNVEKKRNKTNIKPPFKNLFLAAATTAEKMFLVSLQSIYINREIIHQRNDFF